jgi:alpha-L-fucosidase
MTIPSRIIPSVAVLLLGACASTPPAPPPPVGALPSEAQLAWHEQPYYAFVHFSMNTFTDVEWGDGRESPEVFAPTALDCRQWARTAKEAGMTGIILTAKHHDGFCLWPSAQTDHTVAASAWRDGEGDVLRELSDACREYGLDFGVYLSPWDRNHPEYGTEQYNQVFAAQLEEVLGNYGPVWEVWFDGANGEGPNGKRQVYDWDLFHETVFRLQPDAIIFSDGGPGCRWVGNERGIAAETNWATLNKDDYPPGTGRARELANGNRGGSHWVPAEADVSIRPGWYYHAEQDDQVKSVDELEEIWYSSVGRNANLLLNLPVDRRGLVHENDVDALLGLRELLDATFAVDLLADATALADSTWNEGRAWSASRALDGDPRTAWAAAEDATELTVFLHREALADRLLLREAVEHGQRVEEFTVEARVDGAWRPLTRGTTIGTRRILRFSPISVEALRIRFERSLGPPMIAELGLFMAPPEVEIVADADHFLGMQAVQLRCDVPGAEVRYTLDGSVPTRSSVRTDGALVLRQDARVRARAFLPDVDGVKVAERRFEHWDGDELLDAVDLGRRAERGLNWRAFVGELESLDELNRDAEPAATGVCEVIDAALAPEPAHCAMVWEGWLMVPDDGLFVLELQSDDGSRLYLHDALLLDNDGLHGPRTVTEVTGLRAGLHPLRVEWFNRSGDGMLDVRWRGPGEIVATPIPPAALKR